MHISPFNLMATFLFLCAIVHTFFVSKFVRLSEKITNSNIEDLKKNYFLKWIYHFIGEVEMIFGIWIILILMFMDIFFGWHAVVHYFNEIVSFVEPVLWLS
jgi:hypothetical protein